MAVIHNVKQAVKKILPSGLVKFITRIKGEKMKAIDLSYIDLLKEKDKNFLTDAFLLETNLLPRLGLNNERLEEFPEELYNCSGHGLLYWQYPNQFSKYLVELSKYRIESYF